MRLRTAAERPLIHVVARSTRARRAGAGVLAVAVDDLLEGGQRVGGPTQLAGMSSGKCHSPPTLTALDSQLAAGRGTNFQTP